MKNGGVIIYPTDTVYGIGCNPYNINSVKKIYEIKSRAEVKSLPILAYSLDIVKQITSIDKITEKIIKKYWPGPLTLILKLTDQKLKKSLNLENKIAVRIPDSKCTLKLLEKCELIKIPLTALCFMEKVCKDAHKVARYIAEAHIIDHCP